MFSPELRKSDWRWSDVNLLARRKRWKIHLWCWAQILPLWVGSRLKPSFMFWSILPGSEEEDGGSCRSASETGGDGASHRLHPSRTTGSFCWDRPGSDGTEPVSAVCRTSWVCWDSSRWKSQASGWWLPLPWSSSTGLKREAVCGVEPPARLWANQITAWDSSFLFSAVFIFITRCSSAEHAQPDPPLWKPPCLLGLDPEVCDVIPASCRDNVASVGFCQRCFFFHGILPTKRSYVLTEFSLEAEKWVRINRKSRIIHYDANLTQILLWTTNN